MDKLAYERELNAQGYKYICGVDEVGRGPLAGPVVCAAVIMPLDDLIDGVDDSKKLSAIKRQTLAKKINILQATRRCMKNAVESLEIKPDFVITDGNMKLDIDIPQKSIVKGDALSYTIGAASIVAKQYRDKIMEEYDAEYPEYAFASNKGYGTKAHIKGLLEAGICPVHRKSFTKKWQ